MPLVSVSNKVDGVAGWDKAVVDVNNVDENFANARDLGYSRLNRTRVSVIGKMGKYDSSDMYKIQVQSNGKLFVNLRTGSDEDEKVSNYRTLSALYGYAGSSFEQMLGRGIFEETLSDCDGCIANHGADGEVPRQQGCQQAREARKPSY